MVALPTPCRPSHPSRRSRVPFGLAPIVGAVFGLAASGAGHAGDCPADVNGDTSVDGVDLGVVLAFWGEPPELFPTADINGDGAIDAADLTLVLGAWGECSVVGCAGEFAWQPGFEQAPAQYWGAGVYALEAFDDGRGNALYAGGWFNRAGGPGGVTAANIAKWDGLAWTALGSGLNGPVDALAVFDDGSGPALFAGGRFTTAGGIEANRIAKWDGTDWTPLGSGMNDWVRTLAVFDDGTGPALYAGGEFTTVDGVEANRTAKWDGTIWTPLGSGADNDVFTLAVLDLGTGPALYAGGNFTTAGDSPASRVARWDGMTWAAVGSGPEMGFVWGLATVAGPEGPELVAGGLQSGPFCNLQRWNGASWSVLGGCLYDEGSYCNACAELLVGCWSIVSLYTPVAPGFPELLIGGGSCGGIGWSQDGFVDLSGGLGIPGNPPAPPYPLVFAWEAFDDGSGTKIYAGGPFLTAGGQSAQRMAAWDGDAWFDVGGGVEIEGEIELGLNNTASALTVFDDGSGPALYAGGSFTTAGGVEVNRIAKWDGAEWSPLGSGMSGSVRTLAVFDDGSGPALYAGGYFTSAGGVPTNYIARWDGTVWTPLGIGMSSSVLTLTAFDDGSGPALYAGGIFITAGGVEANRIAKWDGTEWNVLGSGMSSSVRTLAVFDDGSGPALYAGGFFTSAGGIEVNRIAKWDGTQWSPLGGGMNNLVRTLTAFDDGTGPALYAGGGFTIAGGILSGRIAKWGCTPLGIRGWHGHGDAEETAGDTDQDEFARPMALMPIGVESPGPSSIEQRPDRTLKNPSVSIPRDLPSED